MRMKPLPEHMQVPARSPLLTGLSAFLLIAASSAWQEACAQLPVSPAMRAETAPGLFVKGVALERRDDDRGAFAAFLASAEGGYPPAQRRLGEIYDHGNPAVPRNYEESIRWYELARLGGEDIPPPDSRMPGLNYVP